MSKEYKFTLTGVFGIRDLEPELDYQGDVMGFRLPDGRFVTLAG